MVNRELDRCRTLCRQEGMVLEEMTPEQFRGRIPVKSYHELGSPALRQVRFPGLSHCHANNQRLQLLMEHTAASYEPDFLLVEPGTVRDQTAYQCGRIYKKGGGVA